MTTHKHKFYHSLRIFLLPVSVLFCISGCQKPNISFGNNFTDPNVANVVVVDTLSTALSTVLVDSFTTAASGTLLIGNYQDTAFGKINASSFFLVAPGKSPVITNQAIYDSIALILRINKTFYGDTTVTQKLFVSQLDTFIQLPANQQTFYNNSGFSYNPTPIGTTDVVIHPTIPLSSQFSHDTVRIRLDNSLGQQLFNLTRDKSDTIQKFSTFLQYFKGLTIYTDASGSGVIYGFKDSVVMRVYYREPGVVITNKFLDFPLSNKSFQFNRITVDRSGTKLQQLNDLQTKTHLHPVEIPSDLTNHSAYLQSITGLQVKMNFPTLRSIINRPDYVSILRAQIILRPVVGSFDNLFALPPNISINVSDQNNRIGAPIASQTGAQQTGSLFIDHLFNINTAYSYDVTNYLKSIIQINDNTGPLEGLIFIVPSPLDNTTLNRAVFGDRTNFNGRVELKLYYVSLIH